MSKKITEEMFRSVYLDAKDEQIAELLSERETAWNCISQLTLENTKLKALLDNAASWAMQRKDEATLHRPDENIYKRILINTWNEVIEHFRSGT